MARLVCLLLVSVIWEGALAGENKQNGFVEPLDFAPIFDSGIASLSSKPVSAALIKADKNQYPRFFDTVVSSSIDRIQKRVAPDNFKFSSENFGFNPIASQGFRPPVLPVATRLTAPQHRQVQQNPQHLPNRQLSSPLQYDIQTVHDANYKVYKPEEQQGEEILAALKKNPSVANYFHPAYTNVEVAHPLKYRKEASTENAEVDYKENPYIAGPSRIRRYAGGKRKENLRRSSDEEEDDPYHYKDDYVSKPKAFDGEQYRSAYKEEKDPNSDYEYPSGYDSGYDHKEYDRIKELSDKQAAEVKKNPGNCKEVKRDGMVCMVCKDKKTGGNYESCSYVAEPKNNQYAYSKEKKFDSNDEPDEPENDKSESAPRRSEKYQESADDDAPEPSGQAHGNYKKEDDDSDGKYKAYYTHSSKPTPSEAIRAAEESESSEESDSVVKPYNYKKEIPELYTDNEPKKDVEHVLAEFKKKDRSACKKVQKNGMTCFQCIDKNGLKNEECMYISESAPKKSHLAYQEVKQFTSKPPTLDGAESQTVAKLNNAPEAPKSAAYVVANNGYGKKIKRKKLAQPNLAASPTNVASIALNPAHLNRKVKRSVETEEAEEKAAIVDETNVAPEEFSGDNSKGAYWSETMPRYSAALGVTLPEFMLSRSEHEVSFDEVVAGV